MVGCTEPNFWDMAKNETKQPEKAENKANNSLQEGTDKIAKAADEAFAKLKTYFEVEKVDAWQAKWLAVPANRKKYEKLADAPEVMAEEILALTNDIIDFAQGEEGGKSEVFRRLKMGMGGFFKNPIGFLQEKIAQGKKMLEKKAETEKKPVKEVKVEAEKPKATPADKPKKVVEKVKVRKTPDSSGAKKPALKKAVKAVVKKTVKK